MSLSTSNLTTIQVAENRISIMNLIAVAHKLSKEKALFILHVMIGMLLLQLMQSEIIIYGLVRKCVKLSPFS